MPLSESEASGLDAPDLRTVFPIDKDHDYRLNLRAAQDPAVFLKNSDDGGVLLRERNAILDEHPERHIGILPAGERLLDDVIDFIARLNVLDEAALQQIRAAPSGHERCMLLARYLETDFALMQSDSDGNRKLVGGCVCFPSSWSPEQKVGLDLEQIHSFVPGLNERLGERIELFLSRLQPGKSVVRSDWGLKMRPDFNHHPLRDLPSPDASLTPQNGYVRVERQMFTGLPPSADGDPAFAFFIRVSMYRLEEFMQYADLAEGLKRATQTMRPEVSAYKDINDDARGRLLVLLSAGVVTPHA
ncbi:MAG TPA: heme-dependent oxidative N-demethylase subunit alpha family protein [Candidatus Peribacteraceae bacterium]|nr:heme-dependent oxidative N-demethylase subunit alpha family protein [Candidatus Peribacteraceae bacterium]